MSNFDLFDDMVFTLPTEKKVVSSMNFDDMTFKVEEKAKENNKEVKVMFDAAKETLKIVEAVDIAKKYGLDRTIKVVKIKQYNATTNTASVISTPINWWHIYLEGDKVFDEGHVLETVAIIDGFTSKKQMKRICSKGVVIDGALFKAIGASASEVRRNALIAVNTAKISPEYAAAVAALFSPKLIDQDKAGNLTKINARRFQGLSSGYVVGLAAYNSNRHALEKLGIAEKIDIWLDTIDDIKDAEGNVLNDGNCYMNVAAGEFLAKASGLYGAKYVAQLRIGGGKGTATSLSNGMYKKACKKHNIRYSIDMPHIVLTESVQKFVPGVLAFPVVVLNAAREEKEYTRTTWQLINLLRNNTIEAKNTVKDLANETFRFFYVDETTPPEVVLAKLGVIAGLNDSEEDAADDTTLATTLFRIIKSNPDVALKFKQIRHKINQLFTTKVAEIYRGRLLTKGDFYIMIPDPAIYTGETTLKAGEYFIAGKTEKILAVRYPAATPADPQVIIPVDKEEFKHLKGLNVAVFNVHDKLWEELSGADFDGDVVQVIFDERFAALKMQGFPAMKYEKIEAAVEKQITTENIVTHLAETAIFVDDNEEDTTKYPVGYIANLLATAIARMHQEYGDIDRPWEGTTNINGVEVTYEEIIKKLAAALNYTIDYAKTGYYYPVDPAIVEEFKLRPNFLYKPKNEGWVDAPLTARDIFLGTANVEEYYPAKTTLGALSRMAAEMVAFMKQKDKKENEVDVEFLEMIDAKVATTVIARMEELKKKYSNAARDFAKTHNSTAFKEAANDIAKEIKNMAATFGVKNVAAAAIAVGKGSNFAFTAATDVVVALFESMEKTTIRYAKRNEEGATRLNEKKVVVEKKAGDDTNIKAIEMLEEKEIVLEIYGVQYNVKTAARISELLRKSNKVEIKKETLNGREVIGAYVAGARIGTVRTKDLDAALAAIRAKELVVTKAKKVKEVNGVIHEVKFYTRVVVDDNPLW